MHIFNEASSNLTVTVVQTILQFITGSFIVWPNNYRNTTECISKCIQSILITSCVYGSTK